MSSLILPISVIVALLTGIVSIIISLINRNSIKRLEKFKIKVDILRDYQKHIEKLRYELSENKEEGYIEELYLSTIQNKKDTEELFNLHFESATKTFNIYYSIIDKYMPYFDDDLAENVNKSGKLVSDFSLELAESLHKNNNFNKTPYDMLKLMNSFINLCIDSAKEQHDRIHLQLIALTKHSSGRRKSLRH